MANIKLSALISSMSGKLGGSVVVRKKGGFYIRSTPKKKRRTESSEVLRIKENVRYITQYWSLLPIVKQCLWDNYARRLGYHSGCGMQAFLKTNLTILHSGMKKIIDTPPFHKEFPPNVCTDIVNFGQYKDRLEFNVWLERPFSDYCVVQVLIRPSTYRGLMKSGGAFYLAIYPAPEIRYDCKTHIAIEKIKICKNNRVREILIKDLPHPFRLWVKFKVVSEYGKVSATSSRYKVELI